MRPESPHIIRQPTESWCRQMEQNRRQNRERRVAVAQKARYVPRGFTADWHRFLEQQHED